MVALVPSFHWPRHLVTPGCVCYTLLAVIGSTCYASWVGTVFKDSGDVQHLCAGPSECVHEYLVHCISFTSCLLLLSD